MHDITLNIITCFCEQSTVSHPPIMGEINPKQLITHRHGRLFETLNLSSTSFNRLSSCRKPMGSDNAMTVARSIRRLPFQLILLTLLLIDLLALLFCHSVAVPITIGFLFGIADGALFAVQARSLSPISITTYAAAILMPGVSALWILCLLFGVPDMIVIVVLHACRISLRIVVTYQSMRKLLWSQRYVLTAEQKSSAEDMDMSYITQRLIATSWPASGTEAIVSNNLEDVQVRDSLSTHLFVTSNHSCT